METSVHARVVLECRSDKPNVYGEILSILNQACADCSVPGILKSLLCGHVCLHACMCVDAPKTINN